MKGLRAFAIILLIFNGISASFGGIGLIASPDGSLMEMPLEWLASTPFKNYLIPGIILLTANGILSLVISILVIIKSRSYAILIVIQGLILTGWIIIQMLFINMFHWLHALYGIIGLLMITTGIFIRLRQGND
ncbi:MAG: hypothetical protein U9N72_09930 [Bacteroidota bacterium]|nr:hypothetical protein [Bacteroidota bacterium]